MLQFIQLFENYFNNFNRYNELCISHHTYIMYVRIMHKCKEFDLKLS